MYDIRTTQVYDEWFHALKDIQTKARINARLRRLELGNFGDVKAVGESVFELRFFFGSGFRIYCLQLGEAVIVLLARGDKSTQQQDIDRAHKLANAIRGQS